MGTHIRCGVESPISRLAGHDRILQRIFEFEIGFDWSKLERRVACHPMFSDVQHAIRCSDPMQEAITAVQQYRHFLALKVLEQDWSSALLSPGSAQLDMVWHIHISHHEDYQRECMLLTNGRLIEHLPILETKKRYVRCYKAHCKRMAMLAEEVHTDYWPNPAKSAVRPINCGITCG